jgi:hypothetical protein
MRRLLLAVTTIAAVLAVLAIPALASSFLDTPRGERPDVTPELRILRPAAPGQGPVVLRPGQPLVVRVAFRDLVYRPDLRTAPAGATLGTLPQVVVDGRVQGHIHLYAQRLDATDNLADPFCIFELEHLVEQDGYDGIAERTCGSLTPGNWRLVVDVNTDSHDAVLKNNPRHLPATDALRVFVPGR